jgi:hypothetical protein
MQYFLHGFQGETDYIPPKTAADINSPQTLLTFCEDTHGLAVPFQIHLMTQHTEKVTLQRNL